MLRCDLSILWGVFCSTPDSKCSIFSPVLFGKGARAREERRPGATSSPVSSPLFKMGSGTNRHFEKPSRRRPWGRGSTRGGWKASMRQCSRKKLSKQFQKRLTAYIHVLSSWWISLFSSPAFLSSLDTVRINSILITHTCLACHSQGYLAQVYTLHSVAD